MAYQSHIQYVRHRYCVTDEPEDYTDFCSSHRKGLTGNHKRNMEILHQEWRPDYCFGKNGEFLK